MKKKLPALFLALALLLSLCACGGAPSEGANKNIPNAPDNAEGVPETPPRRSVKVGLVCMGDENGQGYGFAWGENDAFVMLAADGIDVEWVEKWNAPEGGACEDANRELAESGCQIIFNGFPVFEESMLKAAADYPDVHFVACGGQDAWRDGLPNTHNAFANIYEARYLAGVVGGLKLEELIADGELMPQDAVIGYVGAFDCAEAVSSYSAYFLGVRSVCPGATMKTLFVNAWSDPDAERDAVSALADLGCTLISQHSDSPAVAEAAQSAGLLHTGYGRDTTSLAPSASLTSARIDWSAYFEYAIRAVVNGTELAQDWSGGLDEYAVALTPLNRDLIADGTDEKLDEVKAAIADGSLQVFDTSTFTVNGEAVTHASAPADAEEAVFDGAFHESYFQSAPYFALEVDGIDFNPHNN